MTNIHASCVALNDKGILLLGKSGSGKSDVTLRLIEQVGAVLVADDRVNIEEKNNEITASCVDELNGLLEVRGVGITKQKYQKETKINLVIELISNREEISRLPEKEYWQYGQVKIKKFKLYPFDASTVYKIKLACDEV